MSWQVLILFLYRVGGCNATVIYDPFDFVTTMYVRHDTATTNNISLVLYSVMIISNLNIAKTAKIFAPLLMCAICKLPMKCMRRILPCTVESLLGDHPIKQMKMVGNERAVTNDRSPKGDYYIGRTEILCQSHTFH